MSDLVFLHSKRFPRCTVGVNKFFRDYYTLQMMSEGALELWYDDAHYQMKGKWFWTAFPGPKIRWQAASGCASWHHHYIAFKGPRVERWQADGLWPITPQVAPEPTHSGDWEARFAEMRRLAVGVEKLHTLRAIHFLEGMLLDLAQDRARKPVSPQISTPEPWLEDVLRELEREGNFAPNYDQIAAECGMSLTTLRRRFKQAVGTAIHNYVLYNRIAQARRLLTETDLPIKAIAARLGYSDLYFFAAQFRRLTGATPAAYRRSRLH